MFVQLRANSNSNSNSNSKLELDVVWNSHLVAAKLASGQMNWN